MLARASVTRPGHAIVGIRNSASRPAISITLDRCRHLIKDFPARAKRDGCHNRYRAIVANRMIWPRDRPTAGVASRIVEGGGRPAPTAAENTNRDTLVGEDAMPTILYLAPQARMMPANFVAPTSHGARIYEDPPSNYPDPTRIYMLYFSVRIDANNDPYNVIWHFSQPTGGANPDTVAGALLQMAKANDFTFKVGQDLVDIHWNEATFIYVVFHRANHAFIDDPDQEQYDPIHFHDSKPVVSNLAVLSFDKNSSFYKGVILADAVLGSPAFRCINYMKDEDGKDLKHPRLRTYGFVICYSDSGVPHIVDPDGQNQGPPA